MPRPGKGTSDDPMPSAPVSQGRVLTAARSMSAPSTQVATPAIVARNLVRNFGGLKAVDNVSFTIAPGELMGILGPNGAGKSTLINVVSGLIPLESGSVEICGTRVETLSMPARARLGLLRSFQNTRPSEELTARDYLRVASIAPRQKGSNVIYTPDDLLSLFDLGPFANTILADLPYGVQKMFGLAAVALCQPRVLFLDEPFQGVAEAEMSKLMGVIRHFQKSGVAIGLVEHNVQSVLDLCSRVLVMESGAVIYEGPGDGALRDEAVRTAYLGQRFKADETRIGANA